MFGKGRVDVMAKVVDQEIVVRHQSMKSVSTTPTATHYTYTVELKPPGADATRISFEHKAFSYQQVPKVGDEVTVAYDAKRPEKSTFSLKGDPRYRDTM